MQEKYTRATKSSLPVKMGIALMAVSCLGLVASAAQAQDLRALPGLFKGGKPAQDENNSAPAQQPQGAPQAATSGGSSVGGSSGNVAFANKTLSGAFLNVTDNEAHKGVAFGKFYGGGATDFFNIYIYDQDGSKMLEFQMETVAADVQKPRSFTLRSRKGKPATASILYQNVGIRCFAIAGAVNITAAGPVGGTVSGNISGIEWQQGDECVKALGTSGTFTVQRAVDFHR